MKIFVIGSGGNGQTYFMRFLQNNKINTNEVGDKDHYKHLPSPKNLQCGTQHRIIFIYNDPYLSIKSLFRRNWAYKQIKKIGNPYNLGKHQVNNMDEFFKKVIKEKKDLFGIENQFYNWYNAKLKNFIYFLNFNDIPQETENLDLFLGKKIDYSQFKINKRNSSKNNSIKLYDKIYEKMKNDSLKKNIKTIAKMKIKLNINTDPNVTDKVTDNIPNNETDNVPDNIQNNETNNVPDNIPNNETDNVSENTSDNEIENIPDNTSDNEIDNEENIDNNNTSNIL